MGHASEDSIISQLQSISSIAHRLKETTASCLPAHSLAVGTNDSFAVDSITLPAPPPLLPSLLAVGATHEVATAASRTYQRYAEGLKQHIRECIIVACHEIAELPRAPPPVPFSDELMKKFVSTATEVYLRRIRHWKDVVVHRVKERSATSTKVTARNSHAFNYEFVPLLERFFEENPFPTHADKTFLAKKSNMEYKQIHVWFQNRRNRTKKEGKPLRKKPTYERMKPLDKQNERMKCYVISDFHAPETSQVGLSESANETEIARNDALKKIFPSSSPPHAFPSPYPPVCHYDPFPCKNGPVHFSKPEWKRSSCGKLAPPLSTSMDELVEKFSRLNVRDETRCKGSPKPPLSQAATAAITIIPPRAPHPSLLLCEYHQSANIVQRHPIVRAGISSSKVFQSSILVSNPATLVPPSISFDRGELPGKRKTALLPRRFPDRMHNIRRDTTPSESSSTSPTLPHLFSPDFESRSCSLSSVSSLSTPSEIASTQELPHPFGSPCRSLFADPICLHNLGGMAAIITSSVS